MLCATCKRTETSRSLLKTSKTSLERRGVAAKATRTETSDETRSDETGLEEESETFTKHTVLYTTKKAEKQNNTRTEQQTKATKQTLKPTDFKAVRLYSKQR